ncbi:hypothetical protein [Burkholderia ambifaria]|uniref:hypothetical protein n=1 Tax=Burkholderia ambifaria TaxID=152480 RepID=UPI0009DAD798|nr:hypothetical protein [Burkholderia ambifaria]
MKYINLLGTHAEHVGLGQFAAALYRAFEIVDGEERESVNYIGGVYLKGTRDGMEFSIALSDEDVYEDLPYWIHISADVEDIEFLDEAVSKLVQDKARPAGFRLAKIINFGKRGEERIDY